MEPGHSHLQIIASVALILTAAVVAFMCDILKRNYDQLREMNIELQIRHEVEQKRSRPEPSPARIPAPPPLSAPKERSALTQEKKRNVNPEALAVMARGAALAGSGKVPAKETRPKATMIAPAPVINGRKDWGSLLARNAHGVKPNSPIVEQPAGFHAGFQDALVLSKLVQSRQPVSGLVVSIGVNAPLKADGKLPEGVIKLVESLIGPHDFAAQSAEDEFLLIYPQERGASAQRRLSQVAQQLWDFQLRSLGSFEILFSWGGIEVASESIDDAFASASERMHETKRSRKLLTLEHGQLERAV